MGNNNYARVSIPYTVALSKNYWFGRAKGRSYRRKESHEEQAKLVELLESAGGTWYQAKTHLDIFVEMPTRRSDAINVIDLVADAVKRAIKVDDNWFTVAVDWTIRKENPMVTITVSQEATEDLHFCSSCEEFKPKTSFHKANGTKPGVQGQCKECNSTLAKQNWKDKKTDGR